MYRVAHVIVAIMRLLRRNLRFLLLLALMVVGIHLWQTWSVQSGQMPSSLLQLRSEFIDRDGRIREMTLEQAIAEIRQSAPGSPVAVHVWAEWCSICKLEEHSVSRLVQDTPVLTVAMQSGSSESVLAVMRERGLQWPVWVDPQGQLSTVLGLRAVPAFFVISQDGVVRLPAVGYTTELGMRMRLLLANANHSH